MALTSRTVKVKAIPKTLKRKFSGSRLTPKACDKRATTRVDPRV